MNTDTQFRVLGISGSLRKASFNSGLLRAAQEVVPPNLTLELFDLRGVPFYDGSMTAISKSRGIHQRCEL